LLQILVIRQQPEAFPNLGRCRALLTAGSQNASDGQNLRTDLLVLPSIKMDSLESPSSRQILRGKADDFEEAFARFLLKTVLLVDIRFRQLLGDVARVRIVFGPVKRSLLLCLCRRKVEQRRLQLRRDVRQLHRRYVDQRRLLVQETCGWTKVQFRIMRQSGYLGIAEVGNDVV
jgi:hypothetical protein